MNLPHLHYDRDGEPISALEWAHLFEDRVYRRVAETTLSNGRWVSTVWLGLNHGDSRHLLIFETMVFPSEGDRGELDCDRYATQDEAIAGHEAMCAKWSEPH